MPRRPACRRCTADCRQPDRAGQDLLLRHDVRQATHRVLPLGERARRGGGDGWPGHAGGTSGGSLLAVAWCAAGFGARTGRTASAIGLIPRADVGTVNVGAGLPAIAIGQLPMCWLTHRYRRQASSHSFDRVQSSKSMGQLSGPSSFFSSSTTCGLAPRNVKLRPNPANRLASWCSISTPE